MPLIVAPIIPRGAFVWCRFPFREDRRNPGPETHLHLVYIAEVSADGSVSIYTTSKTWPPNVPLPQGVISVTEHEARAMNQKKPFLLDMRKVGLLPLSKDWFPEIDTPHHGIVCVAEKNFQNKVTKALSEIVKRRPELIERYGPGAPELPSRPKP